MSVSPLCVDGENFTGDGLLQVPHISRILNPYKMRVLRQLWDNVKGLFQENED